MRIDDEKMQRRVGIQPEHRLQQTERRRRRPGLRRVRIRIKRGKRMIAVARLPAEQLGQTIEVEERGGLELRARNLLRAIVQTVAHEAEGERPMLDGPD